MLPLFPSAVESWNLSGFDLVFSSSHAVAKAGCAPGALHICYCHTPMRYVWDADDDYAMNSAQRAGLAMLRTRLQEWDCAAAQRVDHFIANSKFVRERIHEYYGRNAEVIPPPVDTTFFTLLPENRREDFYLTVGALVSYKRFDLVVRAFNRMGRRLVIAGTGPQLKELRSLAGEAAEIRGWVSDEELRRLYRTAKGFIFAAREDFGIVTVEAQACGCPVIAYGAGGSSETVQDGVSGVLFSEQNTGDLIRAVERFESMTWSEQRIRDRVESLSREAFENRIKKFVEAQTRGDEKVNSALQPA